MPARRFSPRADAKRLGLPTYFTGTPCKHGHVCDRYTANGRCLECNVLMARRHRSTHPGQNAANVARWRRDHPERAKHSWRQWQLANPERHRELGRERTRRHRARLNGTLPQRLKPEHLKAMLAAQRSRCAYCRCRIRLSACHCDHITPVALGGPHELPNLQLLCGTCNRVKGAKDPLDFARERGLLL
jgi:5-methylcytosine-specific restriction endonuclease McrA